MKSTLPLSTAALLLAAASAPAFAQRQVQLGAPLDASPLVGSGGSNSPVPGYVPINGNDIITGNSSGLSYFHGVPGTTSPYTFQGNLGTNSLNNFARQSAGPGTPGGPIQPYFLPSSTVSTAGGALYNAPISGGFDSRLVPLSAAAPSSALNARAGDAQANALPIGSIDLAAHPLAAPLTAGSTSAANAPITSSLFGLRTPETTTGAGQSSPEGRPTAPRDANFGSPGLSPSGTPTNNDTGPDATGSLNSNNSQASRAPIDARIDAPQRGTTDDSSLRVTGAYSSLLQRLEEAKRQSDLNNPNNTNLATNNNPNNPNALPGTRANNTPRNLNPNDRTTPGTTALATGVTPGTPDTIYQSTDPTRPNYRPDLVPLRTPTPHELAGASRESLQVGRKLPQQKSLAGDTTGAAPTSFDNLMKDGEAKMKNAKFLEAVNTFQIALDAQPANAFALLGRGNAELAAGMYASSAHDLQALFTRKPEIISVQYSLGDYVSLDRQQYLIQDLTKLTKAPETGNTASFLLCYFCYQTGRGEELKAELDRWAARPWHDDWQAIADKAWR